MARFGRLPVAIAALTFVATVALAMGEGAASESGGAGGAPAQGGGSDEIAAAQLKQQQALEEHVKEVAALKAKLAAAEERAKHAEQGAKVAEAELTKMRQIAKEKEDDLSTKGHELETALKEQRQAAQAIKDASSHADTLSQAKADLEGKIKKLEGDLHSSESGSKKVLELEKELEGMRQKLNTEKEAQKLVVKLRQEKEELKEQLEEAKNNMYHHAQTVWLPQAQESLRNLTEVASHHASNAASKLQDVISEAESTVQKSLDSLDKDERMESVREAAKPWLQDSKRLFAKLWSEMKVQVKYPLPGFREGVSAQVAGMGALARYKDDWAECADYWLVILPLFFVWLLICTGWMNKELRLYCLRVQQTMLLLWLCAALLALLHRSSTLALLSDALSPPQLAAFHMVMTLHCAIVCAFYALNCLFGPNRYAAILQLSGSAWVLFCYYQQLVGPLLIDPASHAKLSNAFTTPHFFRMLFALVLALYGHSSPGKPGKPSSSKTSKSNKPGPSGERRAQGARAPAAATQR